VIKAIGAVGSRYLDLCLQIRKYAIAPVVVTRVLLDMGFTKSRASEINTVAQAPDDVFAPYQARMIGFIKVLGLARKDTSGGKAVETPAARLLLENELVMDVDVQTEKQNVMHEPDVRKVKTDKQKMMAACSVICKLAKKGFTFSLGNVELTVEVKKIQDSKKGGD